jgi:3-oxoacyl-[acyl-carrier protein] reductase
MSTLTDEVIVVTGASSGLGRSMARRFADEGAKVTLVARGRDALEDVAAESAGDPLVAPADVTDAEAVQSVVDETRSRFGAPTCLVNNAGIGLLSFRSERQTVIDVEEQEWRRIIEVNLTGTFLCSKYVIEPMVEEGRGNVINVSSKLGRQPAPGRSPSAASTWGVEGLTRTVADEFETAGINVNGLDPGGAVDTGFWNDLAADDRERAFDPAVMNDAAVLLASQPPGGVTGESQPADEWEQTLG